MRLTDECDNRKLHMYYSKTTAKQQNICRYVVQRVNNVTAFGSFKVLLEGFRCNYEDTQKQQLC